MNTATREVWAHIRWSSAQDRKHDALGPLILVYLANNHAASGLAYYADVRELSELTGLAASTVGGRLRQLCNAGWLHRTRSNGRAYYRLSDELMGTQ